MESAAQEGITRGSENCDQGAERKAQQGATTDSSAVGEDISEFHGPAGREVLAGFEQNSEDEHWKFRLMYNTHDASNRSAGLEKSL